jgi:hypothetical protein
MSFVNIHPFPENKTFAFSMIDDTDDASLEKVRTAYQYLDTIGVKSTKTVWVLPATRKSGSEETGKWCEGVTLANQSYVTLLKDLVQRGHELAMHSASGGNNFRCETIQAYEIFKNLFGNYPLVNVMHGRNKDNLYYGAEGFKGIFKIFANAYCADRFEGHIAGSPYFWGDIFAKNSQYSRYYKCMSLNTLKINPSMPYFDPAKPFVPRWFSSTDLSSIETVKMNLTESSLNRLIAQKGACIAYTYFHYYINESLQLLPIVEERFNLLKKYGTIVWMVPVSVLLNRLEKIKKVIVYRHGRTVLVKNFNENEIADVWVHGPRGLKIFDEHGNSVVIGASGAACLSAIPPSIEAPPARIRTTLQFGEESKMILAQIYLLIVRVLYGRKYRRSGF